MQAVHTMSTLILNIDRDNDYGEKISTVGPLLGYAECYDAAIRLASKDPEDSDSNALFGALKLYEDMRTKNEDVEICLITGDKDVGPRSDVAIGEQLDHVLSLRKYDDLILVTDGAEDDYILPLITSRIKIRYVKHIIVRHNQNIESIYYYIVKALQDKGIINKFIIPIGLVLLTYGLVSLIFIVYYAATIKNYSITPGNGAITTMVIVLGGYLVERGFEVSKRILSLLKHVHQYAQETRISFLSYVVAISLIFTGIASSLVVTVHGYSNPLNQFFVFLSLFVWWVYAAIFAREIGVALDLTVNGKSGINRTLYGLMFSLALVLIVFGVINYIRFVLSYIPLQSAVVNLSLMIMGIVIAILSSLINKYYNDIRSVGSIEGGIESLLDDK